MTVQGFLILLVAGTSMVFGVTDITLQAKVGQSISLGCRVPYNIQDNLVKWYMGNKQLSIGTNVIHYASRMTVTKPAQNEFSLTIRSVVRSDDEIFTCNSYKDTFSKIKLEVQWRPEFEESMSSPYHVVMEEGSEGQLKCTADGKPNPLVTWYRRPQGDGSLFNGVGVTGHTLTMPSMTRYVNDVFMCNASNSQGFVIREMNVTVNFPPEVEIFEDYDIYVQTGEQVLVTCLVQGSPLVDFYWKFQENKIETNWKYMLHVEHEHGYPAYFLTLMIRPGTLGPYDFGNYTCHADGLMKEADAVIQILQQSKIKKHRKKS